MAFRFYERGFAFSRDKEVKKHDGGFSHEFKPLFLRV